MFRNLFSKTHAARPSGDRPVLIGPRIPRHSSGWSALLKHIKGEEGLRILDIGPTSPSNVNFLTGLGHSIYMADLVFEASRQEWLREPEEADGQPQFDSKGFLDQNLDFGGRAFDVVLLWTTLDYLPEPLVTPLVRRLHEGTQPGGKVLAFFHSKTTGPETIFVRYHVTDGEVVEMQEAHHLPIQRAYTNRNFEKLFSEFSGCRFFLAKDNVYEVIITR